MGLGSRLKKAVKNTGNFYDFIMEDIDSQSNKLFGDANTARRVSKFGKGSVSVSGGGITQRYHRSREKGMDDSEATNMSLSGGANYQAVRSEQVARNVAADESRSEASAANAYRLAKDKEDRRQRGQLASRVRRSARADKPGTKGGTLTGGGLGAAGGGQLSFASLLGL